MSKFVRRIRMAWHVLNGHPLITGDWGRIVLAETLHVPADGRIWDAGTWELRVPTPLGDGQDDHPNIQGTIDIMRRLANEWR